VILTFLEILRALGRISVSLSEIVSQVLVLIPNMSLLMPLNDCNQLSVEMSVAFGSSKFGTVIKLVGTDF